MTSGTVIKSILQANRVSVMRFLPCPKHCVRRKALSDKSPSTLTTIVDAIIPTRKSARSTSNGHFAWSAQQSQAFLALFLSPCTYCTPSPRRPTNWTHTQAGDTLNCASFHCEEREMYWDRRNLLSTSLYAMTQTSTLIVLALYEVSSRVWDVFGKDEYF